MVADQGMPRNRQACGQIVEETKLLRGGVLNIVADELDEIGTYEIIYFVHGPEDNAMILSSRLR